ncbi:MAG: ATP-binding cassette domain-containing protein [Sarcina sp.]
MHNNKIILSLKNVNKKFKLGSKAYIQALDDISFDLYEGEVLGIVGESGSGKSTLGRSILRINEINTGRIEFEGINIASKKEYMKNKDMITSKIQIIFQDSTSCLNQRRNILSIISEPLRIKNAFNSKEELYKKVLEVAKKVGINEEDLYKYPSEISGGQRQRVSIARALIVKPALLVADEPIASLDVSMQAQIVNLLKELKEKEHLTALFIAHDLSMVRYISDRIIVMYKGRIVEIGKTQEIYENPIHPYTKLLISSRLSVNFKNSLLSIETSFNEEDEEFNFNNSKLIEVCEGHFVRKSE